MQRPCLRWECDENGTERVKRATALGVLNACCVLWAEGELNWGLGLYLGETPYIGGG